MSNHGSPELSQKTLRGIFGIYSKNFTSLTVSKIWFIFKFTVWLRQELCTSWVMFEKGIM